MNLQKSFITRVPGFRAVGVHCGLKLSGKPDLALVLADRPCTATAVFTTNVFKSAHILYDLPLLARAKGKLQAVIINAGNANAVTGEQGLRDAEQMARLTEMACGLPTDSVFVMSTGVIGQAMPMEKIAVGIKAVSEQIGTKAGEHGEMAVQAIMTTDLVSKEAFIETTIGGQVVKIGGMAKGSGMIHPNMATMLAVIVTDAVIEPAMLNLALKQAIDVSFNAITVDGDTSTNDTVLLLASGQAAPQPFPNSGVSSPDSVEFGQFTQALTEVCITLAKAVARDGEGATKLIEITIRGATTQAEARTAAKTVATSPLVKTAIFGNDPNWGRILAAIGRSGVAVEPSRTSLTLDDFQLVERGEPCNFDAAAIHDWLTEHKEIKIEVDLAVGTAQATVWTCDFSYKYVAINAEYHT